AAAEGGPDVEALHLGDLRVPLVQPDAPGRSVALHREQQASPRRSVHARQRPQLLVEPLEAEREPERLRIVEEQRTDRFELRSGREAICSNATARNTQVRSSTPTSTTASRRRTRSGEKTTAASSASEITMHTEKSAVTRGAS